MVDLTNQFDDKARDASGAEIEELRANYYIQAKMSGSDDRAIGGVNVNPAGRDNSSASTDKRKREQTADALTLMQQIAQLEQSLMDQYGDNFDLDLAAEYLDEDTYKQLASIEDPEERRRAVAKAINEGIKNGSIDPTEIYGDPDLKNWLEKQDQWDQVNNLNVDHQMTYRKELEINNDEAAVFDGLFTDKTNDFSPT